MFTLSKFKVSAGKTWETVRSIKTPLIRRWHFRSPSRGFKASITTL